MSAERAVAEDTDHPRRAAELPIITGTTVPNQPSPPVRGVGANEATAPVTVYAAVRSPESHRRRRRRCRSRSSWSTGSHGGRSLGVGASPRSAAEADPVNAASAVRAITNFFIFQFPQSRSVNLTALAMREHRFPKSSSRDYTQFSPKMLLRGEHTLRKRTTGKMPGKRANSGANRPKSAGNRPKVASTG